MTKHLPLKPPLELIADIIDWARAFRYTSKPEAFLTMTDYLLDEMGAKRQAVFVLSDAPIAAPYWGLIRKQPAPSPKPSISVSNLSLLMPAARQDGLVNYLHLMPYKDRQAPFTLMIPFNQVCDGDKVVTGALHFTFINEIGQQCNYVHVIQANDYTLSNSAIEFHLERIFVDKLRVPFDIEGGFFLNVGQVCVTPKEAFKQTAKSVRLSKEGRDYWNRFKKGWQR